MLLGLYDPYTMMYCNEAGVSLLATLVALLHHIKENNKAPQRNYGDDGEVELPDVGKFYINSMLSNAD